MLPPYKHKLFIVLALLYRVSQPSFPSHTVASDTDLVLLGTSHCPSDDSVADAAIIADNGRNVLIRTNGGSNSFASLHIFSSGEVASKLHCKCHQLLF